MSDSVAVAESKISQYLKAHERLIITVIVAVVFLFGYTKTISYLSSRDQNAASKTQAVLQAHIEANKLVDATAQEAITHYRALVDQLSAQNAALTAARSQRAVVVENQQQVDRTLPPSALSARWTTLLSLDPANVKPSVDGYQLSQEAAVETVTRLETVPQLQEDLAGADKIIGNDANQVRSLNDVVSALQLQVTGRDTQITDQTAACKAEVALVKAQARKSKLRWFAVGFVAGFVTRHVL